MGKLFFPSAGSLALWFQGGLMGLVAGQAFPGFVWQFWVILIANSFLTVSYGTSKEKN